MDGCVLDTARGYTERRCAFSLLSTTRSKDDTGLQIRVLTSRTRYSINPISLVDRMLGCFSPRAILRSQP